MAFAVPTGGWSTSYTRVYLPDGRVSHLLPMNVSPNDRAATSLCGVSNWPAYFLGTGSQAEHDRAAMRPPCRTCERMRAAREEG